ncbi:26658_t:CDS:2, partial [Dentiscutata erythropus]
MIFWKSNPPSPPCPNIKIPEASANLFFVLTFWWANDLMSLGYKCPLEKDDLYVLDDARSAKVITNKFEVEWKKETQKIATGKKPSLLKALYKVLWAKFCLAGVCRFVSDMLIVTSPLVLKLILNFVSEAYFANLNNGIQPPAYVGYLLIIAMFLMQIGAGFACLVLMGPMQGRIMSLLAYNRAKAAGITNEQVKLTQEILLGIRVLKYYAWEDSFADALNKLRNKEISIVRFLLIIRTVITGVSMVIPVFASILLFITFSLTGGTLNTRIVFSSLALFNLLQLPLLFMPMAIASITDAYVAINQINEFLQADELSVLLEINPDKKYAIKVTDESKTIKKNNEKKNDTSTVVVNEKVSVSIDDISETYMTLISTDLAENLNNSYPLFPISQLHNINISIPCGKLIAIIGSVGSGKSSLLSAIVGEMKRVKGEILFGENIGYCPQTVWIQNATLRDNITFGLPFNEEKYQQVIKDCCLEPDLKVLPAGDLTKIGEKGINLSRGQKQRVSIASAVYYNANIILLDDLISAVDPHVGKYLFTNCIQGTLAKKTRLLVTHHLHYLPQVDYIICMEEGKIVEQENYDELIKNRKTFTKLITEY